MEASEGIKSFLEFVKERLTNKFYIPYIFFFFSFNWPIFVYLFFENDKSPKYEEIHGYLDKAGCGVVIFPAGLAFLYLIFSPLINLGIEWYLNLVNALRFQVKLDWDDKVSKLREDIAKRNAEALALEQKNREIELKLDAMNRDKDIFKKTDQQMSEFDLLGFFSAVLDQSLERANFVQFERYVRLLGTSENIYSNEELKEYQKNLLDKLGDVSNAISATFIKIEVAGGGKNYTEQGVVGGLSKQRLAEVIEKARTAYGFYRSGIRKALGT